MPESRDQSLLQKSAELRLIGARPGKLAHGLYAEL